MTQPVSLTRAAVRHARELAPRPVPEAVRQKVALCLLDHLAGCIAALSLPWAPSVTRMLDQPGAAPEAMLWGAAHPIAAADAALGNGMLGHGVLQDDMHVPSGTHIGVVVLPAMLALAQRERLSGPALLAGIVAGYEIMGRMGAAVRSGARNRHFRPSGLSGAYGAAAGAVTALHLDEEVGVNALGFAANFACGLNEWPWSGSDEAFVHAGAAARNAILAVDLARAGLTASEAILEGRDGMFAAYGSGPDAARLFLDGLGHHDLILDVRHKPFPGCNFVQTPVAAALAARVGIASVEEIESIVIRTFGAARRYPGCDCSGPFTSVVQAKMSLQFGVSAALLFGRLDDRTHTRLEDPALARLVARCRLETDPAFESAYPGRQAAAVELTLRDGRVAAAEVDDVPWLEPDAVERRFERIASRRVDAAAVGAIRQAAYGLAEADELDTLFDVFAALQAERMAA